MIYGECILKYTLVMIGCLEKLMLLIEANALKKKRKKEKAHLVIYYVTCALNMCQNLKIYSIWDQGLTVIQYDIFSGTKNGFHDINQVGK